MVIGLRCVYSTIGHRRYSSTANVVSVRSTTSVWGKVSEAVLACARIKRNICSPRTLFGASLSISTPECGGCADLLRLNFLFSSRRSEGMLEPQLSSLSLPNGVQGGSAPLMFRSRPLDNVASPQDLHNCDTAKRFRLGM